MLDNTQCQFFFSYNILLLSQKVSMKVIVRELEVADVCDAL